MKKVFGLTFATFAFASVAMGGAEAQDINSLPAYVASGSISGTLRIWCSEAMTPLIRRWEAGFKTHHPGARFAVDHRGSDIAMAGLYTKSADIAVIGRDPTASELQAFEWIFRYKPTTVELMTGSLESPGKSPALVAFVHQSNPLSQLTLAQLDAIFGHEHLRGRNGITTWGQLGLTGEWANQTIRLYGFDAYSGSGRFFRKAVLNDSRNLNWDRLREFKDRTSSDGSVEDAGRQILDALSEDRFGIAISAFPAGGAHVRPLALAAGDGGAFVAASEETLAARSYPLARSGIALINRAAGQPVDPKIKEFLRYVLSRDGQVDISKGGQFLPLNPSLIGAQLRVLE